MHGADIPLSLYVHLPWCVKKCPYCDFNSWTLGDDAPLEPYLDAVLLDLDNEVGRAAGRSLQSIFIGGGTPSVFPPQQIGRLLDKVAAIFSMAGDVEVTMEANPGTVECGDLSGYRRAGVNRLSIGAQSFDAGSLLTLGRIHSVDNIEAAVDEARVAGFDNINIDLMYGLPAQDEAAAVADIDRAAALNVEHLSWYQLTLEPNTVFHSRPPQRLPDHDLGFAIQRAGQQRLAELGYEQYEVSAYAKGGRVCRHNLNYWLFGDYLAVGAGAHGKFSDAGEIWRYAKPRNPRQYIETLAAGDVPTDLRPIGDEERLFEFMLNALRLTSGFEESLFASRTGLSPRRIAERAAGAVARGLVRRESPETWQVTALGQRFLNDLQAEFLPARQPLAG